MHPPESETALNAVDIFRLDPTEDARWKRLVARHPKGSVFHSEAWLRALRRTYGYQPVAFTTSGPTEELTNGIAFCRIQSWLTGTRLVSLPFSDYCEPLCESEEELARLVRCLPGELQRQGGKYLQVRPLGSEFGQVAAESGWLPSKEFFFHSLDLRPDLDSLWESFDKNSIQRRIQRAERANLSEKCGRSEALLHDFYQLFVLTRRRQGVPPSPSQWFRNLAQELGEALEIRVAYADGKTVASILTLHFRETVYYKYGCSDSQFNALGATPWLFWRAIRSAKSAGATQFDFGRTEENNPGLLNFKNHWVAKPQRMMYWQFPFAPKRDLTESGKGKFAKSLFSLMPSRLQVVLGNLLYRHIG